MATDLTADERLAAFVKSLDYWKPGNINPSRDAATDETPNPSENGVAAAADIEDKFWKGNTKDDFWKEEPAPAEEPEEANGELPESLRLQDEFLKEKGYNWWNPPPHKIKVKGYRPLPKKAETKAVNTDDAELTLDSRCGEPAPRDLKFTPFAAICKFPYKFVSKEWSQPFATAIFDGNKIQNRDWDLYYVYSNIDCSQPCVFVPETQFQALLDEINYCFPDANITVSQALKDDGVVIDFSEIEDSDLRPRWLGHSTSRAQTDGWPKNLEETISKHDTMSKSKDVELFKQKMDKAYEIGRAKKNAAKKAKQAQAFVKKQGMTKELIRAQKYLGLLPESEDSPLPDIASLSIGPVDCSKPAPSAFTNEPIFIAIDVEAHEREPRPVTEVGVATLDTRDLKDVAPGTNGEGWQGAIRARHFRIAEYKHLRNKDFVDGCPEHFEFGSSEMIGKDKIGSKLTSCFHAPFSSTHVVDEKTFGDKIDKQAPTVEEGEERRNIIFLGHDVDNDIAYLRKIGFDPMNRGNLLKTMDTRSMFQAYTHDPNPTSLGRILASFDLVGWHLHNAGNDAVYTLWALLAMAVASATERGKPEVSQRRTEEFARRESVAIEEAKERVKDGAEGWDVGENQDEGGVKVAGARAQVEAEVRGKSGKAGQNAQGFVPWQGSETGLYTENGYPLNI